MATIAKGDVNEICATILSEQMSRVVNVLIFDKDPLENWLFANLLLSP